MIEVLTAIKGWRVLNPPPPVFRFNKVFQVNTSMKKGHRVLTTKSLDLRKFRVQDIVYQDGIVKENWRGIRKLEFRLINDEFIELLRDETSLGKWKLSEQGIPQLPPIQTKDGTIRTNRTPPFVYYVYGADGKRYRYLYYCPLPNQQFIIGTRTDIGARFPTNCLSKKDRTDSYDAQWRRQKREKRLRRLERQAIRRLQGQGVLEWTTDYYKYKLKSYKKRAASKGCSEQ
jgi:hypothetical protein